MFFIGIFGIENKDKVIKVLSNLSCKKCNTTVTGKLIKNFDFFHFFFIPLFKWNEKYYVICDQCRATYIISKEKGKSIEHGDNSEVSYWDLQESNINYYDYNYYNENKCTNCGRKLDTNFQYCPHCGKKIY